MKSDGLSTADWVVVTDYIEVLKPPKDATACLEGCGNAKSFGAIYEILPTFESILGIHESIAETYTAVNYHAENAPEDHIAVNIRAAWNKLDSYYQKLDESPNYYAATCLHPYYKSYFKMSWDKKRDWVERGEAGLQQLWAAFRPQSAYLPQPVLPRSNSISARIATVMSSQTIAMGQGAALDQLQLWRRDETAWTPEQYNSGAKPVQYWLGLRSRYPELSSFAIDLMVIPARSCDCERLFSSLGDLLEP
jgi:hypothetical protein